MFYKNVIENRDTAVMAAVISDVKFKNELIIEFLPIKLQMQKINFVKYKI